MLRLSVLLVAGCAMSTDLGVVQRSSLDHQGASATMHMGAGGFQQAILALQFDMRLDIAPSNSRLALGTSLLGGVPIGPFDLLGRAGVWRAVLSSASEDAVVPSFELGAYVPLEVHPEDHAHRAGPSSAGVTFGIRDDLDAVNYVTVFVGVALFLVPGP